MLILQRLGLLPFLLWVSFSFPLHLSQTKKCRGLGADIFFVLIIGSFYLWHCSCLRMLPPFKHTVWNNSVGWTPSVKLIKRDFHWKAWFVKVTCNDFTMALIGALPLIPSWMQFVNVSWPSFVHILSCIWWQSMHYPCLCFCYCWGWFFRLQMELTDGVT